jgi:phospholipase C
VSWVLASLLDSEHPPAPIEWGEDFTYRVLQSVTSNPALWAKTAIFLTYDENGGFFDHVPPPVPAANTGGEFLTGVRAGTPAYAETGGGSVLGPVGLGFRVPLLLISPFSRGGLVSSDRFDHTSLLRFLETRFGAEIPAHDAASKRPGLTAWRRQAVGDLTSAFNFAAKPDASVPVIPAPAVPNRADPRVLAECTVTGSPGNFVDSSWGTPYPVPASQTMPTQVPGRARRPSGLTGCAPAAR